MTLFHGLAHFTFLLHPFFQIMKYLLFNMPLISMITTAAPLFCLLREFESYNGKSVCVCTKACMCLRVQGKILTSKSVEELMLNWCLRGIRQVNASEQRSM